MINPKGAFPTLLTYLPMNIVNHMANWKVIALVSGNIEAVSGPAAQDRPGKRQDIHLRTPQRFRDRRESARLILNRDCQHFGLGHLVASQWLCGEIIRLVIQPGTLDLSERSMDDELAGESTT